ncbi:MAG: hypothetical protein JXR91_15440 [Deltaproteobacteria bacterium]|nr:hypothetical protein [Deltaproteobacteria bacterium]
MDKRKTNSPLLGYNTNVKHGGHLFHIQTEDSGRDHPHVITHLFTEGTILSSKKTPYDEYLDVDDFEDKIRNIMKNQHKTMFVELRDGVHDEIAEQILGHILDHKAASGVHKNEDHKKTGGFQIQGDEEPLQRVSQVAPAPKQTARITIDSSSMSGMSKGMSIFESPSSGGSFGDALISDKSLDEVILSYLADELDD